MTPTSDGLRKQISRNNGGHPQLLLDKISYLFVANFNFGILDDVCSRSSWIYFAARGGKLESDWADRILTNGASSWKNHLQWCKEQIVVLTEELFFDFLPKPKSFRQTVNVCSGSPFQLLKALEIESRSWKLTQVWSAEGHNFQNSVGKFWRRFSRNAEERKIKFTRFFGHSNSWDVKIRVHVRTINTWDYQKLEICLALELYKRKRLCIG